MFPVYALGPCINCNYLICYSPQAAPSIYVKGNREPICITCFEKWNKIYRVNKGLKPIPLKPNAYGAEEVQ
jgi:hypothetical protein